MRFPPSNEDTCHAADIINLFVVNNIKEILPQDHNNSIEPILYQLPEIHKDDDNLALFAANSIDVEKTTPKLKELPSHLEYAFLDNNRELPVIISSLLSNQEKRLKWFTYAHDVILEVNDYLILRAYEFGVKYSICSRVVIMEIKNVLHALLRQFLVFKS
ncbi:hypothetical protein Tco_0912132 [Tanacetum coccineum]